MSTDIFENGRKLPLIHSFYTLQGEGFHTGKAAYFIRIGGCDIGCNWCDTKYSWRPDLNKLVSVEQILTEASSYPTKSVVVTGGEPLMYNMEPLTTLLKQHGFKTFLETSGAYPLTGIWDWICLSPKSDKPPLPEIVSRANELKVIIYNDEDFLWAEKYAALVDNTCHLYLQPEWSRHKANTKKIIEYIKKHPKWRLSVQLHKYLGIP